MEQWATALRLERKGLGAVVSVCKKENVDVHS
jgi:hypothetical protein